MRAPEKRSPGLGGTGAQKKSKIRTENYNAKPARLNIWFPIYPADFAIDTAHLSVDQVGAYMRVLNRLWRDGGQISCDDRHLAQITGVSLRKWRSIKSGISLLFNTSDPNAWTCD